MDIKAKIEEIVGKIKTDKTLAAKFKEDPIKAVESVIGVDLPDDKLKQVVDGIKAKMAADDAGGLLGKVKKLF
ncbi:MAG: hypothetical protein GX112_03925 [Clostridiaceae bacterium]|nr:hypothetical protein [Clostridiaceae bacterium]